MWSLYASYRPIYIDEGRLNNRHTSVYKCSLAAPQNASCKMIIELNRHLSTKTEHNNLHEGRFYCRSAVFDCISRQLSIYSLILWSSIQFKCNGASLYHNTTIYMQFQAVRMVASCLLVETPESLPVSSLPPTVITPFWRGKKGALAIYTVLLVSLYRVFILLEQSQLGVCVINGWCLCLLQWLSGWKHTE